MNTYQKFKQLNIDCSLVGFVQNREKISYFCTPKGANIIGWAGVDGIHYCFIRGFGEMVFAVNPSASPGDYLHPIAQSFEDLLCLLLSCGDLAVVEQAHLWDREHFDAFLRENQPTSEQMAVLEAVKKGLSLSPMQDPFTYIKELQSRFDYSRIRYTDDYYDQELNPSAPESPEKWKVYYGGGYWKHTGRDRAGEEIILNSRFIWGEESWHIPAIYCCAKGLVIDFCVEIEPERIKSFLSRWEPSLKRQEDLTREERERFENENPLEVDFHFTLLLNGREIRPKQGSGLSWIPESCLPEGERSPAEAKRLLEQYGLDTEKGWSLHRWSCPWATRRKPVIRSLVLKLRRQMTSLPGIHFQNSAVGEVIPFVHPISGVQHQLTVEEYEQQQLDAPTLMDPEYDFPTHYTQMTYRLAPDLPDKNFSVQDCRENDEPRRLVKDQFEPQVNGAACIGIIGGADGPTAILLSNGDPSPAHLALSALQFKPAKEIEWRMVFREKLMEDIEITLI